MRIRLVLVSTGVLAMFGVLCLVAGFGPFVQRALADVLPGTFSSLFVQSPDQTAATIQANGTPTNATPALVVQKQRSPGDWVAVTDFNTGGGGGLRTNMDSAGSTSISSWVVWNMLTNRWEAQASTTVGASMIRFLTSGTMEFWTADRKAVKAGDPLSFVGALTLAGNGNVGIRQLAPTVPLDVTGKIKGGALQITGGAAAGKVLTSDAVGNATWQTVSVNGGGSGVPDACVLTLAPDLYAVAGKELNLYFETVTRCTRPINQYAPDITFGATGDRQMDRYWRYTPDVSVSASDIPLTYAVFDLNANLLTSASSTVHVSPLTAGSEVTRNVLIIGDSTTAADIYPQEIANLFSTDAMHVNLIGTKGEGLARHESNSGKNYSWFRTSPDSPFVMSGSFNFGHYLAVNSLTLGAQDWVIFNLGINDIASIYDDQSLQAQLSSIKTDIDAMIASVQTGAPGVRIAVALIIPPSASQDSFGLNYGSVRNVHRYRRNKEFLNKFLIETYGQRTTSGIHLLPINSVIDPVYNMQSAQLPANARNATAITTMNNGVHPDVSGYMQEADAIHAFLKYWQ